MAIEIPQPLERDVDLYHAIWRAFLGRWDETDFDFESVGQDVAQKFYDLVTDEIRQKAFDGKLPIWGINKKTGLFDIIPSGLNPTSGALVTRRQ